MANDAPTGKPIARNDALHDKSEASGPAETAQNSAPTALAIGSSAKVNAAQTASSVAAKRAQTGSTAAVNAARTVSSAEATGVLIALKRAAITALQTE